MIRGGREEDARHHCVTSEPIFSGLPSRRKPSSVNRKSVLAKSEWGLKKPLILVIDSLISVQTKKTREGIERVVGWSTEDRARLMYTYIWATNRRHIHNKTMIMMAEIVLPILFEGGKNEVRNH